MKSYVMGVVLGGPGTGPAGGLAMPLMAALALGVAAIPFIYYCIALYSTSRYFRHARREFAALPRNFTPPVSSIRPIRGVDPGAYENFASFCRQDYPDYEMLFCVDNHDDPVLPVIERLRRDFPEREIRVLYGSGRIAANDKVAKLARLVGEARHEHIVISDSDVRVRPDYLRTVVAPLANLAIGAVTCFYTSINERVLADRLQSVGMLSDFYAGVLVAWQLDGIKFALGPSISTTRTRLAGFGGYQAIENRPADDLLVGRLIADQGVEVVLLPYTVAAVADYHSLSDLMHKRLRWIVVMRHMRPWGHLGLLLTQGLPWSLVAVAVHPSLAVALAYLGTYFVLRAAMTLTIGAWGLRQPGVWKKLPLLPLWDAVAFAIWMASFARRSIRWRGADYYIRNGTLVPAAAAED